VVFDVFLAEDLWDNLRIMVKPTKKKYKVNSGVWLYPGMAG